MIAIITSFLYLFNFPRAHRHQSRPIITFMFHVLFTRLAVEKSEQQRVNCENNYARHIFVRRPSRFLIIFLGWRRKFLRILWGDYIEEVNIDGRSIFAVCLGLHVYIFLSFLPFWGNDFLKPFMAETQNSFWHNTAELRTTENERCQKWHVHETNSDKL